MLSQLVPPLVDLLFPPHCLSCKSFGVWFCADCRLSVDRIRRNPCSSCLHLACACEKGDDLLNGFCVVGFYHDPQLRRILHGLKYEGATCLMSSIGEVLRLWREEREEPWPWAGEEGLLVQHLPSTETRVRNRGYDQAKLLADEFVRDVLPWAENGDLLRRRPHAIRQAEIEPGPLRLANVRGTFVLSPVEVLPTAVLLVDDVVTTGSTLREAATLLKASGVERVYGFALALGA